MSALTGDKLIAIVPVLGSLRGIVIVALRFP